MFVYVRTKLFLTTYRKSMKAGQLAAVTVLSITLAFALTVMLVMGLVVLKKPCPPCNQPDSFNESMISTDFYKM